MSRLSMIIAVYVLLLFTAFAMMTGLVGCDSKYCTISGCPKEAYKGGLCIYHKCLNSSCKNPRVGSQSYCKECLDRALENYK